jgi:DNA-binding transcriptional LysR family regulator
MADIETRLLRYFVALAEQQHFARAAARLHITPPTLTHQIKKLESELGAKLLERKGNRGVIVTDAGQRFLDRAREVLRQVEEAAAVALQAERGEVGRLDIGFMTAVACAGLLPTWIAGFQQANPAINITLRKLTPRDQIAGIIRKELDAGFTRAPNKYPVGLRGIELHRQPMIVALPSDHPLTRSQNITPAMLRDESFVNISAELDVGFWGHTETVAELGNFTPRVVKREDDFITILTYVALGYGIAIVPKLITGVNVPNVVFRDIAANPIPFTTMAFVYRQNSSPAANLLIKHMRQHALPQPNAEVPARSRIAS